MPAIVIDINIFVLAILIALAFFAGFILRSGKTRALRQRVHDLEKEMLNSDARILELEKEKADLLRTLEESKIPVIPLKSKKEGNGDPKNRGGAQPYNS